MFYILLVLKFQTASYYGKKYEAVIILLTILEVIDDKPEKLSDRIRSVFSPYSVISDVRNSGGVNVLTLKYYLRRGNVQGENLYKYCIGSSKKILCDKNISLKNSDLERFESNELNEKLLENFLLDLYSRNDLPEGIKTGFYDPEAEYPYFAESILQFCSDLTVITHMPKFYEIEAARVLKGTGAVMKVSNSLDSICSCNVLISPSKLKRPLPTHQNTVIFTVCNPIVHIPGIIINGYDIDIPEQYANLKPETIETDYFLSGLYSLCFVKELADIIPYSCHTDIVCFSSDEMIKLISP